MTDRLPLPFYDKGPEPCGFRRTPLETQFCDTFREMAQDVHNANCENGFHDDHVPFDRFIALAHSELSEALEADRKPDTVSKFVEASGHRFTNKEEELADLVIRVMDRAALDSLRVAEAVVAKARFNRRRGHMHGGKAY